MQRANQLRLLDLRTSGAELKHAQVMNRNSSTPKLRHGNDVQKTIAVGCFVVRLLPSKDNEVFEAVLDTFQGGAARPRISREPGRHGGACGSIEKKKERQP